METVFLDWASLALRWLHIITGIAWIGSSFYFVWLDISLEKPDAGDEKLAGHLWAIHGGGFYHVQKYKNAPDKLPEILHWFKWEAYWTWISGIFLLSFVYYASASAYMINPDVSDITANQSILIGVGTLIISWFVYDLLCKSPLGKTKLPFAATFFAYGVGVAYILSQLLAPRAAYIHVGAMIGTVMAVNVFMVIIPNQKKAVAQMSEGKDPEPHLGLGAKQRSLHNNYFTLPVLFIMISNHYPFTFGHKYSWLVLAAISLIGIMIRHWFNLKNRGVKNYWLIPASVIGIIALAVITAPAKNANLASDKPIEFSQIQEIINNRCISCHSSKPTDDIFKQPPNGVIYDTPEQIKNMAAKIKVRSVDTNSMPLANKTKMTKKERLILGQWVNEGAKIK